MDSNIPLLGEWLIHKNLLSSEQLMKALEEQSLTKDFLGEILLRRKFISEEDLTKALAEQFQIPYLSLNGQLIDYELAMSFSPALVMEHFCLPIRETDNEVLFAITNPLDVIATSRAEREAHPKRLRIVLVPSSDMREALKHYERHLAAKQKRLLG